MSTQSCWPVIPKTPLHVLPVADDVGAADNGIPRSMSRHCRGDSDARRVHRYWSPMKRGFGMTASKLWLNRARRDQRGYGLRILEMAGPVRSYVEQGTLSSILAFADGVLAQ